MGKSIIVRQSTDGTEEVTNAIITKLYTIASTAGSGDVVDYEGRLHSSLAYAKHVNYLSTQYAGKLFISVDSQYIDFEDSAVEQILLNANIGDGTGVTTTVASSVTASNMSNLFKNNTQIISFDELDYFTLVARTIPNQMFQGCTHLASVDLSTTIEIGSNAFSNTALTEVNAPNLTRIGNSAFYGCSSLGTFVLPSTLTSIGDRAFANTQLRYNASDFVNLQQIYGHRDGSLFKNGVNIASGNSHISGDLYLPNLTYLGDKVFMGQSAITKVNLPALQTLHGQGTFANCTGLTEVVSLGAITEINGDYNYSISGTFEGCTSLTSVTLPDGLTNFRNAMFQGCSALETLNLPQSLSIICGNSIFTGCTKLLAKPLYFRNNLSFRFGDNQLLSSTGHRTPNVCAFSTSGSGRFSGLYLPKQTAIESAFSQQENYGSMSSAFTAQFLHANAYYAYNYYHEADVLYLRDITSIGQLAFCNAQIGILVINNVTPPQVTNAYLAQSSSLSLISNAFSSTRGITIDATDIFNQATIGTIYVPDAAVDTYKAASQFANWISKIQPLSECPRVTVAQAETGSIGLIEAYM